MWPRQRYLDETLEMLSAKGSQRWPQSTTLLYHLSHAHNKEWAAILNEVPEYRTDDLTPTPDSQGRIPLASLTTGSGDSVHRFYKLRSIDQDGRPFYPRPKKRWPNVAVVRDTSELLYRIDANYLYVGPSISGAINVCVSHRPCKAGDLSSPGTEVEWPDGHEYVIVFATAALATMKGGAETDVSREFAGECRSLRNEVLTELARQDGEAPQMEYSDDASEWTK